MQAFDKAHRAIRALKYMKLPHAEFLRDFIVKNDIADVLEIGFYRGKSSAYIGAILEDRGRGHLVTIDKSSARKLNPNINEVLEMAGVAHRVTPVFAVRSHTWQMGKMIRQTPRPQFDLCYFDGGHTWDVTGLGFILVDMLLRPGGWIIFDDLNWTIAKSLARTPARAKGYKAYSDDEKTSPGVRLVFETIVPHMGYRNMQEVDGLSWGIAQKPL